MAARCITKFHAHHYLGFAQTQWKLFEKEEPRRIKPLLYVYRVLLTGIHLMRSGEIEANLIHLNHDFKLDYIDDLIAQKLSGTEHGAVWNTDMEFYRNEYERLKGTSKNHHFLDFGDGRFWQRCFYNSRYFGSYKNGARRSERLQNLENEVFRSSLKALLETERDHSSLPVETGIAIRRVISDFLIALRSKGGS